MDAYRKTLAWWKNRRIETESALEAALSEYRISFAYHSGRIENDRVTYEVTREIFERDAVSSYSGDLTTLLEIRNARDASEFFIDCFGFGKDLDERLIRRMHKLLTRNTYDERRYRSGERPGEYKRHDYVVSRNEIGAAPEDVLEEMRDLMRELKEASDKDALAVAAYFHALFEEIHPFADGNGRTGRLAMNYYLVSRDHPPLIVFYEDRSAYYSALEAWDEDGELTPLFRFLRGQTVKSWARQVARAEAWGATFSEL